MIWHICRAGSHCQNYGFLGIHPHKLFLLNFVKNPIRAAKVQFPVFLTFIRRPSASALKFWDILTLILTN
jgi:hypothetical protein